MLASEVFYFILSDNITSFCVSVFYFDVIAFHVILTDKNLLYLDSLVFAYPWSFIFSIVFFCVHIMTLPIPLPLQSKFMESVKEVTTWQFLSAVSQLCHMDTNLAEWVWLQFFPRIWKILSEKQQQVSLVVIGGVEVRGSFQMAFVFMYLLFFLF